MAYACATLRVHYPLSASAVAVAIANAHESTILLAQGFLYLYL